MIKRFFYLFARFRHPHLIEIGLGQYELRHLFKSMASFVHPVVAAWSSSPTARKRTIRNSSQRGDLVFDPFGGSGTTLIAAEKMGRREAKLTATGRTFAEQERLRQAASLEEASPPLSIAVATS